MKKKLLIFKPLRFFSHEDEDLFFKWIDKIDCIDSYSGIENELHLSIKNYDISFNEYRNLKAIFRRYNLDNINQLKKLFMNSNNAEWFKV